MAFRSGRPASATSTNSSRSITEQAAAMEVVRGPSGALYGANGLHGTLNFLLPEPGGAPGFAASGEAGPHDYRRAQSAVGHARPAATRWWPGITVDHDGDFRANAGYDQAKGFVKLNHQIAAGELQFGLAGSGARPGNRRLHHRLQGLRGRSAAQRKSQPGGLPRRRQRAALRPLDPGRGPSLGRHGFPRLPAPFRDGLPAALPARQAA